MISSKAHGHVASAVGGKTARACDSCIRKRARWYCAADDAFLCQSCDSSVHSANPLARRHERVRLKTASLKSQSVDTTTTDSNGSVIQQQQHHQPSWVRGVTKKARTPRHNNKTTSSSSPTTAISKSLEETLMSRGVPLVPEVGSDEMYNNINNEEEEEEEHQLLYRVPIFDPVELCNNSNNDDSNDGIQFHHHHHHHQHQQQQQQTSSIDSSLQGLVLPSDMDFAEFAADVESLLGRGLENESFGMEELGILDSCSKLDDDDDERLIKMEKEDQVDDGSNNYGIDLEMEMAKDEPPFQLSFEYDDEVEDEKGRDIIITKEEEEHDSTTGDGDGDYHSSNGDKKRKRNILLSLNYEAVITAWSTTTHGSSPWTNGHRPDFDLNECWPDCLGGCGREFMHHQHQQHHHGHGYEGGFAVGGNSSAGTGGDGGREARVSRYREKRRTRLFSKKIRYEVRKLNAEKRPRMKGRFVKRTTGTSISTSFAAGTNTSPVLQQQQQPYTSLLVNTKK
ncbi:Zinc finger protein CONSTANS-LIKE 16 [Linum perenne]